MSSSEQEVKRNIFDRVMCTFAASNVTVSSNLPAAIRSVYKADVGLIINSECVKCSF